MRLNNLTVASLSKATFNISLDALTGGEAKWMQHFMNVTQ
jgi:hypothetical protein